MVVHGATERAFGGPARRRVVLPDARSRSLSVPSQEPESANAPSPEMTTS